MNQKLFEFIWDQSKKNTDKQLIEFLVNLCTKIYKNKEKQDRQFDCVYDEINHTQELLCKEIDNLRHSLTDRMDRIEGAAWSKIEEIDKPIEK